MSRDPLRPSAEEVLDATMRELREQYPVPQPWETPDEMQPAVEMLLEAHELNKLSRGERPTDRSGP